MTPTGSVLSLIVTHLHHMPRRASRSKQQTAPPTLPERPPGWELAAAVLLIVVAAGLRGVAPERIAVEHYDEGVYASNRFFDADARFRYPARHLYAPPLFPALVESWQLVDGSSGWGVNFLAGVLLAIFTWIVLRKWVDPLTGIVGGLLVATSDPLLLYSRSVLTDVPLILWMLLTIWFYERSVTTNRTGRAILAGLAAGAAWCTKYNGWLALAVIVSGSIPFLICQRTGSKVEPMRGPITRGLVLTIGIAVACWSVVWIDLQDDGGYASVAANHSRYFVGFGGWGNSLIEQARNLVAFTNFPTFGGLGAACFALALLRWRQSLRRSSDDGNDPAAVPFTLPIPGPVPLVVVSLLLAGLAIWPGLLFGTAAAIGSLWGMTHAYRSRSATDAEPPFNPLWLWLLSAWFWGLTLATPLYTPYPRITLPWLLVAILLTAVTLRTLLEGWVRLWSASETPRVLKTLGTGCTVGMLSLSLFGGLYLVKDREVPAWEDRRIFARFAEDILKLIREEPKLATEAAAERGLPPFIVYTLAEPGLFYHLRERHPATAPIANLGFAESDRPANIPVYLIVGPHGAEMLEQDAKWERLRSRFETKSILRYRPSLLVRSNRQSSNRFGDIEPDRVSVYRLRDRSER